MHAEETASVLCKSQQLAKHPTVVPLHRDHRIVPRLQQPWGLGRFGSVHQNGSVLCRAQSVGEAAWPPTSVATARHLPQPVGRHAVVRAESAPIATSIVLRQSFPHANLGAVAKHVCANTKRSSARASHVVLRVALNQKKSFLFDEHFT